MSATNHTEHYELSQYTDDDRPTYRGDYNSDMSKIDAAIYAAASAERLTAVEHTGDLTGDGTDDNPLGVANTIARTGDIPKLDAYATAESVTQAIAAAVADRLRAGDIKAGDGIDIQTSGNQVTISYNGGGLSSVSHDTTLTGNGTSDSPLSLAKGTIITQSNELYGRVANLNDYRTPGAYNLRLSPGSTNLPISANVNFIGFMLVLLSGYNRTVTQLVYCRDERNGGLFYRDFRSNESTWSGWSKISGTPVA